MTQGIYVSDGGRIRRPKTKREIKIIASEDPHNVALEGTSMLSSSEYEGPLDLAPPGLYFYVGPDPYTKRTFYGHIEVKADGTVVVR